MKKYIKRDIIQNHLSRANSIVENHEIEIEIIKAHIILQFNPSNDQCIFYFHNLCIKNLEDFNG